MAASRLRGCSSPCHAHPPVAPGHLVCTRLSTRLSVRVATDRLPTRNARRIASRAVEAALRHRDKQHVWRKLGCPPPDRGHQRIGDWPPSRWTRPHPAEHGGWRSAITKVSLPRFYRLQLDYRDPRTPAEPALRLAVFSQALDDRGIDLMLGQRFGAVVGQPIESWLRREPIATGLLVRRSRARSTRVAPHRRWRADRRARRRQAAGPGPSGRHSADRRAARSRETRRAPHASPREA